MNIPFSKDCLYRFVSAMDSNMVLDMSQNPKQFNKAIVHKWNDSPNQKFAIRQYPEGSGKFAIFCAKNNMVVVIQNEAHWNGARIVLELWIFQPANHQKLVNKRGFLIKSYYGKSLDICEQKCKNNQQVIQWDSHGKLNQIWIIQAVY